MKYAIIEIAGQQFKVKPGDTIQVNRLDHEVGTEISLDRVLLTHDGKNVSIGTPTLSDANLIGKITDHSKGEKIRVATYRSKSRFRKVKGHRQYLTSVQILEKSAKKTPSKPTTAKTKTASK